MFLEAIIATTCIAGQQVGCGEATSAYYKSNKELQEAFINAEDYGKSLLSGKEYVVYIATPLYAVAAGKPASFRLKQTLILNLDFKQGSFALQWNY